MFIDLINDYKIICMMVFVYIVSFKIIISMKRGIFRFVDVLFLIFEKGNEEKNSARYCEIRKYAFVIFEKKKKKKKLCQVFSDL